MPSKQSRERHGRFDHNQRSEPETSLPGDDLSAFASFLPAGTVRAWRAIAPLVPETAYLSGGTGLTAHLRHRVSRDLDFFTEEPFDAEALARGLGRAGTFAPSLVEEGTLNGVFEDTKIQFLDASNQRLLSATTTLGGIRLASLGDIAATKLKVIQDRGALRDYFDLMRIDPLIPMEEALTLLVEKYQLINPQAVIANIVRGLGYLDDVEDDPSLPQSRGSIEAFWVKRQRLLVANID